MKGLYAGKGATKVKGPTEVNFKRGGSQKIFREWSPLSHFQNDGATIECSTLDFSGSS